MRTLFACIVCLGAAVVNASASQLSGTAHVACEGASHTVTVAGTYYSGIAGEYTSIVLERQAVGICVSPEMLMDYAQPFAPQPSNDYAADYTCTFEIPAPALPIVYRYVPYGVKADNSLVAIWSYCDTDWRGYAQLECVDAPFSRGTVFPGYDWTEGMSFRIVGCEDDCWATDLNFDIPEADLAQYAGEPASGLLGQVVDVYGRRTHCGMIGAPTYDITRIERAPLESCGPVPAQEVNWGSVKALYR